MSTAYIRCPHCGARMRTMGHKQMNVLFKQLTAVCRNPACLFSATVDIEISKQIHESLAPNPEITGQLRKSARGLPR